MANEELRRFAECLYGSLFRNTLLGIIAAREAFYMPSDDHPALESPDLRHYGWWDGSM